MTIQEYFDTTVARVLKEIGCTMQIDIRMLDHDTLKGKSKQALGVCYKYADRYEITIDEFFVQECYSYFVLNQYWSTWPLNGVTLEHVVCHELAHIYEWKHGKKHTSFMYHLLESVTLPEKYINELNERFQKVFNIR